MNNTQIHRQLENKVRIYLIGRGLISKDESIKYIGLRQKVEIRPEEFRNVHTFRFGSSAGEEFESRPNYLLVDADSKRMEVLITPHFSEDIFED